MRLEDCPELQAKNGTTEHTEVRHVGLASSLSGFRRERVVPVWISESDVMKKVTG